MDPKTLPSWLTEEFMFREFSPLLRAKKVRINSAWVQVKLGGSGSTSSKVGRGWRWMDVWESWLGLDCTPKMRQKIKGPITPDIVILDFQMPVMNGLEATRQIADIAPNTAMLLYTMHNSEQLVKDAHAAGIQAVFSKSDGGPGDLLAWLSNAFVRR